MASDSRAARRHYHPGAMRREALRRWSGRRGAPRSTVPIVRTEAGDVRGLVDGGLLRFLGVPYAAPPVGDLRLRPPRPVEPWTGVLDATVAPTLAPQQGTTDPRAEDCLRLTVTTPSIAADASADGAFPVVVWLHGGAFVAGAAEDDSTRPHALARAGAVVVSVSYRLGALGWLHLGHLSEEDADSGNLGLLDQAAALRWVGRNIAAFGGDPARVTLAGQSAGAMAATTLMVAAEGTFGGAILQSGAGDHVLGVDEAAELADRYLHLLGARTADDIRARSVSELLRAQGTLTVELGRRRVERPRADRFLTFAPVAGTPALPVDPVTAIRSGRVRLPGGVVVGANAHEERVMVGPRTDDATVRTWLERIGAPDPAGVRGLYADDAAASPHLELAAMRTDLHFRLPAARLARALTDAGGRVWHYDFRWPSSAPGLGAAHGIELRYVFGTVDDPAAAPTHSGAPPVLTAAVRDAWSAMVEDVRPAVAEVPWAPFGTDESSLILDAEIRRAAGVMAEARAVWGPDLAPR